MLKLMKYEFKKQAFSKIIVVILAVLVEALFGYGLIVNSEDRIISAFALMFMLAFGALLFVSFECIHTYSNDLKTKCGYMLFMVPHSTYTVIGAKVLSAIAQIFATIAAFVAIEALNAGIIIAKYDSISEAIELIQRMLNLNITSQDILFVIAEVMVTWISIVILAFFSITLSTTFLANKKGKGLASFGIFLVINYVFTKLIRFIFGSTLYFTRIDFILEMIIVAVFTAIIYLATAYMLEKKVSL